MIGKKKFVLKTSAPKKEEPAKKLHDEDEEEPPSEAVAEVGVWLSFTVPTPVAQYQDNQFIGYCLCGLLVEHERWPEGHRFDSYRGKRILVELFSIRLGVIADWITDSESKASEAASVSAPS